MTPPRIVCISGCSSGMGLDLAGRLAHRGATVYAGLRSIDDAAHLPPGVRPLALDVTSEEQIAAAVDRIERDCGRLDTLINNAGVNAIGPWEMVPSAVVRGVFDVNFFGAVALTRAVLPLMRRQRSGRIVMVSSLSALVGLPADGIYAASKFALEGFAESLYYEVRRWNISVRIVNPGGYATALMRKAWRPASDPGTPYAPLLSEALARAQGATADSSKAADAILAVAEAEEAPLRNALDDTARMVFRVLKLEPQCDRDALVRNASGLGWWIDGQPPPAQGV